MQEKTTYPVGTVLWCMIGRRQNSEIRWYAAPLCIEYVDKHKFLNADNIGGGWNSIGKNYFLTREECLENFKAKGNSLLEKILINAPTPEGIVEKPRTEWDDYEFHLFGAEGNHDASDTSVTVYAGFYDGLKNITDRLLWHSKLTDGYGKVNSLTLREIYEQCRKFSRLLTVFHATATRTEVYQCGNYEDGKWENVGHLYGFA